MNLYEQMISLGYHLLAGAVFGFLFSFLSLCSIAFASVFKAFLYIFFSMFCTLLFYYGLYCINGGMTHFYLMAVFLWGLYLYYHLFYEMLLPLFFYIKKMFRPLKKKLGFAKKEIYAIIEKQREKRRRSKLKNEQRKKKRKNEKV